MDDLGLGKQALEGGNRELAISYFARYIQVNPASEEAWLCLGRCVDKPERREYCYRKVLALNPLTRRPGKDLLHLEYVSLMRSKLRLHSRMPGKNRSAQLQ